MKRFAMEFVPQEHDFRRLEISTPRLQAGEVLVEVVCCTLCGSDLHTFCGRRQAPARCVLGHEIIGTIAEWGKGPPPRDFHGNALRSGQRVTWTMAVGCGTCFFCKQGLPQKCQSLFKYGHEPGSERAPTGGLSSHCRLVPGTPIFPVPEALSDEVASPANCATATVSAALRLLAETHPLAHTTALIMGAGMLGLTAAAQLGEAQSRQIVVVDPAPERLQHTPAFGATHSFGSSDREAVRAQVLALTEGRGADIVLDFAGVPAAVETCLSCVRTGGAVLLAGSVFPSEAISLAPEQIVRRMLTLRGLHNYRPDDLHRALNFLQRTVDRFPFGDLVRHTFPLEQAQEAFAFAATERPVRVAIRP